MSTRIHPFKKWIQSSGLTQAQVAALAGTSATYVRHIASGYKRPSWEFAKRLERVTRGQVTAVQFMDFQNRAA